MTLVLIAVLNAGSWVRFQFFPAGNDSQSSFGLPFPVYITDSFEATATFYIFGLLLDIAVALTTAILVTWLVEMLAPDQRRAGIKEGESAGEGHEQVDKGTE
jgi:hypothetical protein